MSTRDSNRHKRFSEYGVIDRVAVLAGKEEALLAAALALEDEQEISAAEQILQDSAVVLSEGDAAAAEAAAIQNETDEVLVDENDLNSTPSKSISPKVVLSKSLETPKTPEMDKIKPIVNSVLDASKVSTPVNDNEDTVRRKRGRLSYTQTNHDSIVNLNNESPVTRKSTARKRTLDDSSNLDKSIENKKKSITPTLTPEHLDDDNMTVSKLKFSLCELGKVSITFFYLKKYILQSF